ncbi:MAG: DUF4159 domain-containing protein, partial [Planctomycetales bacterium]
PRQVKSSLQRAVEFLKHQQNPRTGGWIEYRGVASGTISLCTLALLHAGETPDQPGMAKALRLLRSLKIKANTYTYAVALQTMVFAAAKQDSDRALMRRNVRWLEQAQQDDGRWSYTQTSLGGSGDNSNTQFALLALHEAERYDETIEVNDQLWHKAINHWTSTQNTDGSWGYSSTVNRGTGSMTCAGISSVLICSKRIRDMEAGIQGGRLQCCGRLNENLAVERGLTWLGNNFSVGGNPGSSQRYLYYMYGLERAGRLSSRRYLRVPGAQGLKLADWYRQGVAKLVGNQDPLEGSWKGTGLAEAEPNVSTSLALLFLAKGRRPMLMGKVRHGPGDDWNNHPDDAANLTSYVERVWERDLTWVVTRLEHGNVDDLLQVPVLFISGQEPPTFSDKAAKTLREYVERGGVILAESCCNGKVRGFEKGFREFVDQKMFPERPAPLLRLGPQHPVWRAEEAVPEEWIGSLHGMNVSCRTGIFLCDRDLSCKWQYSSPRRLRKLAALAGDFKQDVHAANSIGINVLKYATDGQVNYRYETPDSALSQENKNSVRRGQLVIAKVKHGGESNAAPAALPNLRKALSEVKNIRVSLHPKETVLSHSEILDFPALFMHGRQAFSLTDAERASLRTYVADRGGFLLADSVCGNDRFARSFREEMRKTFSNHRWEKIPAGHPMLSSRFGGYDLRKVRMRKPTPEGEEYELVEPVLEGVRIGERIGVVFSPYDVSCALEDHASGDCKGYHPQDALRIGVNAVLYSLQQPQ